MEFNINSVKLEIKKMNYGRRSFCLLDYIGYDVAIEGT